MRVAIVTTYRPRACGIAVFSGDLRRALLETQPSLDVDVVSIVRGTPDESPPEVVTTIRQDVASDYPAAAAELARRGTDVVLIEHEYGIFGGEAGEYVLGLTAELQVPFVVTLHTLLSDPSPRQAATLAALCRHAALVTVFTETARQMAARAGSGHAGPGPGGPARRSGRPARGGGLLGRTPGDPVPDAGSRPWPRPTSLWTGSPTGPCCPPSG